MLRRDLRLRRIKIISSIGILVRIAAIVGLGLAGGRAYAIVLGNNVFAAMPFAIDLFIVRGWRPDGGWWRLPDWRGYRDALTFGAQRIAGGLMSGGRDAAETAVLPATLGFTGIGLVNRAQALYATTLGRMTAVFADTVYPFLPRESRNPQRYAVARHALSASHDADRDSRGDVRRRRRTCAVARALRDEVDRRRSVDLAGRAHWLRRRGVDRGFRHPARGRSAPRVRPHRRGITRKRRAQPRVGVGRLRARRLYLGARVDAVAARGRFDRRRRAAAAARLAGGRCCPSCGRCSGGRRWPQKRRRSL